MKLGEAILHAEDVARKCERSAASCDLNDSVEAQIAEANLACAADHRQLAEWLKELKELRARCADGG